MSIAPEFYDPKRALSEDWKSFFFDNKDRMFILPCIEGDVEIQGNWMLLNINLCQPLIKRYRPISRDKHLMLSGIYDKTEHAKRLTQISRSLEEYGYTREELGRDIIQTAMNALNLCYTHLGGYIQTMDIFSIADTVLQEGVKEACTIDYGNIDDHNIKRMETVFREKCSEIDELFTSDRLPINVFRAPLLCGSLKRLQFHQFLISPGPRTDTDEEMFTRPVVGSFLAGMKDIKDLMIESRAAAKATHYSNKHMSTTSYGNRKINIQNSQQWHLYPGDCGSTVYMTYVPNKKTVKRYLGKFYLNSQGMLTELTTERFSDVINKPMQFRVVPGCLHTDGYCETCGGTITKSFSRNGNVGFLSNVNTGAPVAQQVLSAKHLTSTDATEYEIPDEIDDIFIAETNDIFLRPSISKMTKMLAFGFQTNDISRINDLKYHDKNTVVQAAKFSEIKYIRMGLLQEDGTILQYSPRTNMGGKTQTYPHLSHEVLAVIREHPEDIIIQDNIAWLLLRNINPTTPVMQCTVINNSIRLYVSAFRQLVTKDVERYTSMNDFMRDLSNRIWERVDTHITHIETLARACMITSNIDYDVPVMTDPDNVRFGRLMQIISMRSIGGLLAFERVDTATNNPVTYITKKRHGIYDEFMGYQDMVEANMNWPSHIDRLHIESFDA